MPDTSSIFTSGELIESSADYPKNFCDFETIPSQGFNILYKARRYGKWYVLKCLKPENRGNPFFEEQLNKEFELGVLLTHPNIVSVQSIETVPELGRCIVMEYVDGRPLNAFLDEHPSVHTRKRVLSQLLDAMEYYHKLQVVHRDLKPSNLLITHNGDNLKVIDFGLSDSDSHAILKHPAGSLRYAAPEQLKNDAPIDLRADIFSLGVIIDDLFQYRYWGVSLRCRKDDPQKRYKNTSLVRNAIRREDGWRIAVPVILSITVIIVLLMVARPFKGDDTPNPPKTASPEANVETASPEAGTAVDLQDAGASTNNDGARKTVTPPSNYRQWMTTEADNIFNPVVDKFEKRKYLCMEEVSYDIQFGYAAIGVKIKEYLDQHEIEDVFERQGYMDSIYTYIFSKVNPIWTSPIWKNGQLPSSYDLLEQGRLSRQQYDSMQTAFEAIDKRIQTLNAKLSTGK